MAKLTGLAAEYCARQYGGLFQSADSTASVGTTVQSLVKSNPERAALVIINLSANTVVIRPKGNATLTEGIILTPSGGSASAKLFDDLTLPSYDWTAIADGPASAVFIVETTRYAAAPAEDA